MGGKVQCTDNSGRADQFNRYALRCSLVVAMLLCGCAGPPISEEQRALDSCLFPQHQSGWRLLDSAPPIADVLRAAIASSKDAAAPEPDDYELWFSHADGRFLRCVHYGSASNDKGGLGICSSATQLLARSGDHWIVDGSWITTCHERR